MPFRTSIDPEQGITRVWFDGVVTGRDIIAATGALVAEPGYDERFDQLWVLTDVASLVIAPEELKAMVAHDMRLVEAGVMGQVRVAIVVTGELRAIAIRLYQRQMQGAGQDVRLFDTEAEAEAWLRRARGV